MSPAVQAALDAHVQSTGRLVDELLVALADVVRERHPSASAIRLDLDWTQDHRQVVNGAQIDDDAGRSLGDVDEPLGGSFGWSAGVDELLSCLAEIIPSELESRTVLTLP